MKKIVSVVLSLLAMTALASCGGDAAASPAGKYTLDNDALVAATKAAMPADAPKEGPAAEMAKMMIKMLGEMKASFELKADNTCTLTATTPDGKTEESAGTWKLDGEKISITAPENGKDVTKSGTFKDGVITIEEEKGGQKMSMIFKKAE